MSEVTMELIQSKQTEINKLIEKLTLQIAGRKLEIEGTTIILAPGEHYAGSVLDADGDHMHHLVLMAGRPTDDLNWQAAMDWAKRVGGDLPTRQEQALLYASCKPHLKPEWHWSSETHEENASCAWYCGFSHGNQDVNHKSYEGAAVAVRRV